MAKVDEDRAVDFLLNRFSNPRYSFGAKGPGDTGFDLWLVDSQSGSRTRAEVKAHSGSFRRNRNIVDRLIFNTTGEKDLFETGGSVIVRVFNGDSPPRVFLVTNAILGNGAELRLEPRYVVRGNVNYGDNSITELR